MRAVNCPRVNSVNLCCENIVYLQQSWERGSDIWRLSNSDNCFTVVKAINPLSMIFPQRKDSRNEKAQEKKSKKKNIKTSLNQTCSPFPEGIRTSGCHFNLFCVKNCGCSVDVQTMSWKWVRSENGGQQARTGRWTKRNIEKKLIESSKKKIIRMNIAVREIMYLLSDSQWNAQ